jgi:histidinol-phosphate/aromatic aminotransferase/cobyric acid decarboxylase-like protein
MKEDTLLFESDLIFEDQVLDRLIADKRSTLAVVDKFESWMDGTCMVLDVQDNITDFISGKSLKFSDVDKYYKTVNIYKFSRHFSKNTYVPFLEAYRKAMGQNEYYETVIKLIAMLGTNELKAMRLHGERWYEIDDVQDLDIAETLFTENSLERYRKICSRYGGYWRYPKLLDFCYLVNPYFPPRRMMQEIEANNDAMIRNYPSGMRVNSLLASRNFGVRQDHIVVGNGAAELIKALMENGNMGTVGMVRPTFEEYANRYTADRTLFYYPETENFAYSAEDLICYFNTKAIDSLIVINPDNPSGNFIPRDGLLRLVEWAKAKKIRLVVDESFCDFADTEEPSSLIDESVLALYDGLYIVKSISKSYGVPGLRLGILATADENCIIHMKTSVTIWNINSCAEFYMQIYEKYEKDYTASLKKIKKSRALLVEKLSKIPYLRVMPSQANYLCCELTGRTAEDLAAALLEDNILIKCLTSKIHNGREYIRLAVRTDAENEYLVDCLWKQAGQMLETAILSAARIPAEHSTV